MNGIITPIKISNPAVSKLLIPDFSPSWLNARLQNKALTSPITRAAHIIAKNPMKNNPGAGEVAEVFSLEIVIDENMATSSITTKVPAPAMPTTKEYTIFLKMPGSL